MTVEGSHAICKRCSMTAVYRDGVWIHDVDSQAYEPEVDDHEAVPMLGTVAGPDKWPDYGEGAT